MANANVNAIKYAELTDEHIKDIKRRVEMFVKSEEYWDKFVHHSSVPRGHRTFSSRRVIAPKVKPEDVVKRAEFVAPRPTKIAVATFERTVDNYGDKIIYSREDLQYHFDDTVDIAVATLKEIAVQKKDFIKGKPFIESRAVLTAETYSAAVAGSTLNLLATAEKAAIIFRKNKVKRWANGLYLAHITPEGLKRLREELAAKGVVLDEKTKVKLGEGLESVGQYGDFMYSVCTSELLYKDASNQYVVYMGKRAIDGTEPVDVAKLEGESDIELINNGLGSGILSDVDGNLTTDDNKQQGSIGINMDGLGADITDDLCILDCTVSLSGINEDIVALQDMHGYTSASPALLLSISAVAAADGTAISSPIVVLKEVDSDGDTITAIASGANAGKYNVVAGNKYYYSVAKTDYTTKTGTVVMGAADKDLEVALAAS